jgi:hypothetical protein
MDLEGEEEHTGEGMHARESPAGPPTASKHSSKGLPSEKAGTKIYSETPLEPNFLSLRIANSAFRKGYREAAGDSLITL